MSIATSNDLAITWAALARAVERKLQRLHTDLDPDRAKVFRLTWPFFPSFEDTKTISSQSSNLISKVLISRCGGLPQLTEFNPSAARLALLSRAEIHAQLCILAIARRPGVLRCIVDKQTRQSMQAALGSALFALNALGRSSQRVVSVSANWQALRWVCIGFRDWQEAIAPQTPTIHQMIALSLPEAMLLEVLAAPIEPAEHGAVAALELLKTQGIAWPT